MKIAISGASGLVGTALCSLLTAREQVQILRLSRSPNSMNDSAHAIAWDPKRGVTDLGCLENLDAFIHLAGRSISSARWTDAEKKRLTDSRVLATEKLVRQITQLDSKPKLFLSASAVGIYGDCGSSWVDEESTIASGFLAKLAADWERASDPLHEFGVRVVRARLGVVLSSRGGVLQKLLPLFRCCLGGVLGSGDQYMSWISLPDCSRALMYLIDRSDLRGPFNLVSPNPITNLQFTKSLGKTIGRPTFIPAPAFALRMALGEMADALLLSSCRARPSKLSDAGFAFDDLLLEPFLLKELRR